MGQIRRKSVVIVIFHRLRLNIIGERFLIRPALLLTSDVIEVC